MPDCHFKNTKQLKCPSHTQVWTMFSSYARFEVLSVVLPKIQIFCDVKLFHLVCTVLGVLATKDEGTMLFKNVINFTYSGTSQRIWIYSHLFFFLWMFQCNVEGNMPLFLRCLTKCDSLLLLNLQTGNCI